MTLCDMLDARAATAPSAPFLLGSGHPPASCASIARAVGDLRTALGERGVRPGHRLAVVLESGPEMVVTLLGVMGCATAAPLDPQLTTDEDEAMLRRLGAHALLTAPGVSPAAERAAARRGLPVLTVSLGADPAAVGLAAGPSLTAPPVRGREEVALALQTSGTTGEPRVVPLTHANLAAAARAMQHALLLGPSDRSLAIMPLFHIHGLSMVFASLASGGSAACPGRFDASRFHAWLAALAPTWLSAAPTVHRAILERTPAPVETTLRFLRSASSAMPPTLIRELETRFGIPFVEAYGMTEASPQISCNPLPPGRRKPGSVGRPAGPEVRVLDAEGRPLPPGVRGEIAVRGPNVTAGYEGDDTPALVDGWLRTGDEGFLDDEGYLFVSGRLKDVINRGGEKISPREIDDVLCAHPAVAQAVAFGVADERLGEEVAAAVVPVAGAAVEEEELMAFAAARLAPYKVPRRVLLVERLPQGGTAKVSRRAVASALAHRLAAAAEPAPPEVVETVARVWAEVLEVAKPSAEADFFSLGGDSLAAASAAARLRKALDVEASVVDFFREGATVRGLAGRLARRRRRGASEPADLPAVSFAQQRLWFMDQLSPGEALYNMARAWRVRGPLDGSALARALRALAQRHEVLRTAFVRRDGSPLTEVREAEAVPVQPLDLSGAGDEARAAALAAEIARPFDLALGRPMRVTLARLGPDDHVLLVVVHHIAFDDWSAGVLARELTALYHDPAALPPLPMQYRDYARWERSTLQGGRADDLQRWWRAALSGAPPLGLPPPAAPAEGSGELVLPIPQNGLADVARAAGATLFMTMLAAWKAALAALTGQHDLVVGTDDAHRDLVESEPLIGFFVNLLPIRTDLSGDPSFEEALRRVRSATLAALEHKLLPFEQIVEAVQPSRGGDGVPLVPALFVYQSARRHALRLGDAEAEPYPLPPSPSRFPLTVFVRRERDGITLRLAWRRDRVDDAAAERLARRFLLVLEEAARDPRRRLSEMATRPPRPGGGRRRGVSLDGADAIEVAPKGMPRLLTPAAAGVDLRSWAQAHRGRVDALLAEHGALLFRGFGVRDEAAFEATAAAMCGELFGEYGDLPTVAGRIYRSTPYPPDKRILYHNESSHTPCWPSRQWFCCVLPSAVGGETPLVDCREVLRALPRDLVDRFRQVGLVYVRTFIPGLDVSWQAFFRTDARDEVEAACRAAGVTCEWRGDRLRTEQRAPAVLRHPGSGDEVFFNQILLHHPSMLDPALRASLRTLFGPEEVPRDVRYGDGEAIPDAVVARVLAVSDALAVASPWEAGDVVMVDNMRVAHARNPYQEPRRILVAMGDMVTASTLWRPNEQEVAR